MSRKKYSDYWGYFPSSKPIPVKDGIQARSKRGQFGERWWSRRWIEVLESFGWDSRLQRGRRYARKGQVMNIDVLPGRISARVQGSQRRPYSVRITIRPLEYEQWEQVIDALAAQAIFSAQLLSGEMPPDIEEVFRAAGVSLFPTSYEVEMSCSCPDWAAPCKHIAAVYYLMAEEFDRDPFLLFALRGRTREQVTEALRDRRAAAVPSTEEPEVEETVEPLEETIPHFWELGKSLRGFQVTIAPPQVETMLLKRLGPPAFSRRPEAFRGALTLAYASVTDRALALAFGDEADGSSADEANGEE